MNIRLPNGRIITLPYEFRVFFNGEDELKLLFETLKNIGNCYTWASGLDLFNEMNFRDTLQENVNYIIIDSEGHRIRRGYDIKNSSDLDVLTFVNYINEGTIFVDSRPFYAFSDSYVLIKDKKELTKLLQVFKDFKNVSVITTDFRELLDDVNIDTFVEQLPSSAFPICVTIDRYANRCLLIFKFEHSYGASLIKFLIERNLSINLDTIVRLCSNVERFLVGALLSSSRHKGAESPFHYDFIVEYDGFWYSTNSVPRYGNIIEARDFLKLNNFTYTIEETTIGVDVPWEEFFDELDIEYFYIDGDIHTLAYMEENYTLCSDCGEWVDNREVFYDTDDNPYCESCFDVSFFYCRVCNELHNREDGYEINGAIYCQTCVEERFDTCNNCGNYIALDDVYYDNDGYCYCRECFHNARSGWVIGYHDFSNWKALGDGYAPYYLGFELETDDDEYLNARCDFPDYWDVKDQSRVVFEEDGSISGVEAITHPFTIEYFRKTGFEDLVNALDDAGFYTSNRTGLHVHISRKAFTNLGLLKLIYIFRKFQNDVQDFGRRDFNDYCELNGTLCDGFKRPTTKITYSQDNRYLAVNFKKNRTIELRSFKAELDYDYLSSVIEFCNNLVSVCKLPACVISKMRFEQIRDYHLKNYQLVNNNLVATPQNEVR